MDILGWKLWYGSTVYTSVDSEWNDLPIEGVTALLVIYNRRANNGQWLRRVDTGIDRYFLDHNPDNYKVGVSKKTYAANFMKNMDEDQGDGWLFTNRNPANREGDVADSSEQRGMKGS